MIATLPLQKLVRSCKYAKAKSISLSCLDRAAQVDTGRLPLADVQVSKLVLDAMFSSMDRLTFTTSEKVLFTNRSEA